MRVERRDSGRNGNPARFDARQKIQQRGSREESTRGDVKSRLGQRNGGIGPDSKRNDRSVSPKRRENNSDSKRNNRNDSHNDRFKRNSSNNRNRNETDSKDPRIRNRSGDPPKKETKNFMISKPDKDKIDKESRDKRLGSPPSSFADIKDRVKRSPLKITLRNQEEEDSSEKTKEKTYDSSDEIFPPAQAEENLIVERPIATDDDGTSRKSVRINLKAQTYQEAKEFTKENMKRTKITLNNELYDDDVPIKESNIPIAYRDDEPLSKTIINPKYDKEKDKNSLLSAVRKMKTTDSSQKNASPAKRQPSPQKDKLNLQMTIDSKPSGEIEFTDKQPNRDDKLSSYQHKNRKSSQYSDKYKNSSLKEASRDNRGLVHLKRNQEKDTSVSTPGAHENSLFSSPLPNNILSISSPRDTDNLPENTKSSSNKPHAEASSPTRARKYEDSHRNYDQSRKRSPSLEKKPKRKSWLSLGETKNNDNSRIRSYRSRSKSPPRRSDKMRSRSPFRKGGRRSSPQKKSKSPRRQSSPGKRVSPVRRRGSNRGRSKTPPKVQPVLEKQSSPSHRSPKSLIRRRSKSPVRRLGRSPPKKRLSKSPTRRKISPKRELSPLRSRYGRKALSPIRKSPVRTERKSSPKSQRRSSPIRRKSPNMERKSSPVRRKSPNIARKPSPVRRKSPKIERRSSPVRRKSPPRRREKSKSPQKSPPRRQRSPPTRKSPSGFKGWGGSKTAKVEPKKSKSPVRNAGRPARGNRSPVRQTARSPIRAGRRSPRRRSRTKSPAYRRGRSPPRRQDPPGRDSGFGGIKNFHALTQKTEPRAPIKATVKSSPPRRKPRSVSPPPSPQHRKRDSSASSSSSSNSSTSSTSKNRYDKTDRQLPSKRLLSKDRPRQFTPPPQARKRSPQRIKSPDIVSKRAKIPTRMTRMNEMTESSSSSSSSSEPTRSPARIETKTRKRLYKSPDNKCRTSNRTWRDNISPIRKPKSSRNRSASPVQKTDPTPQLLLAIPDGKGGFTTLPTSQLDKSNLSLNAVQLQQLQQLSQQYQTTAKEPPKLEPKPTYSSTRNIDTHVTSTNTTEVQPRKPTFSQDPLAYRPMMQGYVRCNRPQLRNLQKQGFFDDDSTLYPTPLFISPIEGSIVKFENLSKKTTKEDFLSIISSIGPIKDIHIASEAATVVMVNRIHAKELVRTFNNEIFMGSKLSVKEDRPAKNIKYFPVAKYEWKTVLVEQFEKAKIAKIQDLEPIVAHRAFFPKDVKSPFSVKFTVRVSFQD